MKAKRLFCAVMAVGLGLAAAMQADDAMAQKGGKGTKTTSGPSDAPLTKKAIGLPLAGISWSQTPKQVAEAVDKVLDEDYRPLYKDVQPGVKMKALDAQLAEEKSQFRRSRIDFGRLPTGIDATPLRGEYTYQNKEALMSLTRKGGTMHFFFIQDKLWKIISEYKLSESSSLGKSFTEAVVKLAVLYGGPGRVLPPDDKHFATEVDWKDANSHLRAIERGDTALGLAFEDSATLANLASLRTFKAAEESAIDPAVAAAVRGGSPDPGPPPDKKDDKKDKPKK